MNKQINQCCTFRVNGFLFGVDVLQVREIVEHQRSTPVPLTSCNINGLINLRGEIVTSIDLRERFPRAKERSDKMMNVVVMTEEEPVSLVVNEVGEVIDIDAEQIEPPPDTLHAQVRPYIQGVYKLKDQLMLILNVEAAIDVSEQA